MGEYGITLPFLVGALGRKSGQLSFSNADIRKLLHEIVNNPMPGYVTEIRWCPNIDAPVLTVSRLDENHMPLACCFCGPGNKVSLGFSLDAQSLFGLNCKEPDECLEKLIQNAVTYVNKSQFSRNYNLENGRYEYGNFTDKELHFIKDAVCKYQ